MLAVLAVLLVLAGMGLFVLAGRCGRDRQEVGAPRSAVTSSLSATAWSAWSTAGGRGDCA